MRKLLICMALNELYALFEQVKAIEQQLSENAISNRKTQESLLSAERQLSQLDAENILLRQLRVDLDASVRECSQLKRQIISFEAELGSLRAENTQMRQNLNGSSSGFTLATFTGSNNGNNGHNGHSGESDLYSSTFQRISTQVPLNGKERSREQYAQSDATADRDQRPIGYPPPAPQTRDSGVNYQQDQQISSSRSNRAPLSSFASPTYTHLRSSREEGEFDRPRTSLIPGDASLQSSFELDGRRSSAVQSLADIMGGRRSTVHGDPSQRSTLADILSPPIKSFPSSGSYEGDRYRSDGNVSTNDTCFLSPMTAPVNTAPVPRRQVNLDIPSRRNSSGGGMSTFYDDNGHAAGAVRAPFGTSQSAASSMVSYEETDRRLTALMTEKALLNEESSRLLQRGGKVLRERTRLQYVEARLDELGKEIAVERKKLSGKPG